MPGLSNAKRNARRRQRKKAKAKAKREVPECGICATPFCKKCPKCCQGKVPVQDWLAMGCECAAPKICICCAIKHVKGSAKRHCLEIDCVKKSAKCPWCRVDMDVTDIYDNADIQ